MKLKPLSKVKVFWSFWSTILKGLYVLLSHCNALYFGISLTLPSQLKLAHASKCTLLASLHVLE